MNPLDRIAAKRRERQAEGQAASPKAQAPANLNPLDRIAARRKAAQPEPMQEPITEASPRVLGQLVQYQAAVDGHIAAMAPMKNLDERQDYKRRAALPEILPFVHAYFSRGERHPNSVAVQAMVWLFDVGEIADALSLALALIVQGIHPMPRKFDRDMKTFVCDAVYDWANERLKANQGANPYLDQLIQAIEAGKWQLHPAVLSKLYVMQAKHLERLQAFGPAASACMKAMEVNPGGHGCKGLYQRCLQAQKLADEAAA